MPCTTILVGKQASASGSCMMARNDDSGAGKYTPKKFVVISPKEQPREYTSVISRCTIQLPDNPLSYTSVPDVIKDIGEWAECGVNSAGVGMSATETITSNPRVLGADPLVVYDAETGTPGGIGEEDLITITLPYVKTAREGVLRLGSLVEQYGTYEMNGIAFSDDDEIWYLETIGGHHWMARRVPDDSYAVNPNQLGIDFFDFQDAASEKKNYLCSADLQQFVKDNDLDLTMSGPFNPRDAFGSHDDSDHVYNTPRAWYMERYFNPNTFAWDGIDADYRPDSDDLPWCLVPEKKITVEDVKYILSSHFQGTPYDPYNTRGDLSLKGSFRPIGVNRTSFVGLVENRPGKETLEWLAFGPNPFNTMVPFYSSITETPDYLNNTTAQVNTDNLYWTSRLIGAMADASYAQSLIHIERYQNSTAASGRAILKKYDALLAEESDEAKKMQLRLQANQEVSDMLEKASNEVLGKVLYELSNKMKCAYARSDA